MCSTHALLVFGVSMAPALSERSVLGVPEDQIGVHRHETQSNESVNQGKGFGNIKLKIHINADADLEDHSPEGQLRILILSDMHDDIEGIELLAKEIDHEHIDVILCAGDISSIPNKEAPPAGGETGDPPCAEELSKYEESTHKVLHALRRLRPSAKLVYIPGNHDPCSMFLAGKSRFSTEDGTNAFSELVELAPDLVLAGWGGAVESSSDDKGKIWRAYPWPDTKLFEKGIGKLAQAVRALPAQKRVIYLSHVGPSKSSTSTMVGKSNKDNLTVPGIPKVLVTAGSDTLLKEVVAQDDIGQRRAALFAHGHVHHAVGQNWLGAVPVLNPGSLKHTKTYALVTLARSQQGADGSGEASGVGQWMATDFQFKMLGR